MSKELTERSKTLWMLDDLEEKAVRSEIWAKKLKIKQANGMGDWFIKNGYVNPIKGGMSLDDANDLIRLIIEMDNANEREINAFLIGFRIGRRNGYGVEGLSTFNHEFKVFFGLVGVQI